MKADILENFFLAPPDPGADCLQRGLDLFNEKLEKSP